MSLRLASAFAAAAALAFSASALAQDAEPADGEKVEKTCEVKKIKNDDGSVDVTTEGDCSDIDVAALEDGSAALPEGAKWCKVKEIKNDDGTVERTMEGDCDHAVEAEAEDGHEGHE